MFIKGSKDTPTVYLSISEGKIDITGDSFSLSVGTVYKQIFKWLETEPKNDDQSLICRINLEHMNSETVRMIVELIGKLNILKERGKEIRLIWEYDGDNEHIYEKGLEFTEIAYFPLILKKIENASYTIGI